MPRIGKGQRALNSAHNHRDEMERILADPWMSRYLPASARDWFDAQLRKDRFYLYSKEERRVLAEIIEEMKPFSGFGGYSISELIDMGRPNKWDGDEDTEKFIDGLVADRPDALPLRMLRQLVNVCRMSTPLPPFEGEFALPPDVADHWAY
jgi:hypothetical protein